MVAAASMAGVAGAPQFAFGQTTNQKTFLKVFMRGGADGLHLFPPTIDPFYREHRPNIAILEPGMDQRDSALSMVDPVLRGATGYRAMNPNLVGLHRIWNEGRLMVAPSTAMDDGGRSHFDNQRWIGTGQRNNIIDGYLNRYLQNTTRDMHPLRGAVLGKNSMSTEVRGGITVPVVQQASNFSLDNENFRLEDPTQDFCNVGCRDNQLTSLMREISSHEVDLPGVEGEISENQLIMLDSITEVQASSANDTPNAEGMNYSNSSLGRGLRLTAQLLKSGVPLEVAALDWNIGWDSHSNQVPDGIGVGDPAHGYNQRMFEGGNDFLTFYLDMQNSGLLDNVVVLVGTEFGRTVLENGSRGTDHGKGSTWFAFGGPTTGGIAPDITTLDRAALFQNRFVPTRTEYRDLVAEIMVKHMSMDIGLVETVLPGHQFLDHGLFEGQSAV